jgi:RNA polymerase sigma-70 factor (ECF subfamily)
MAWENDDDRPDNGVMTSIPETATSTRDDFGLEFLDSLYRYAMVLTRNRTDAEDLVQETYVRAIEAYGRLRENSNVKGWLFTILRNQWLNQLRRRRTGPQFLDCDGEIPIVDGLPGNLPDAQSLLEGQEDVSRVRGAIDKLPPEFQEVLVLREFEELSYQEISSVLSCPAGTVMSRLARARARLRVLLTEESDKALAC